MIVPFLTLALTTQIPDVTPDVTSVGGYKADWIDIKGVAVCDFRPDKVACWDLEGKPAPEIQSRAELHLSQGTEVQFTYGKKNRHIVLEQIGRPRASFSDEAGEYMYSHYTSRASGASQMLFLRGKFGMDETEGKILVKVHGIPSGDPVEVPFKEGATAEFENLKITLGGYKPAPEYKKEEAMRNPMHGRQELPGKRWFIFIDQSRPVVRNQVVATYSLLGEDGEPIHFTNKSGDVISSVEYAKEFAGKVDQTQPPYYTGVQPVQMEPGSEPPKYFPAFLNPSGAFHEAQVFKTNVDPKHIRALRVTRSKEASVLLTGFPLDPKQS